MRIIEEKLLWSIRMRRKFRLGNTYHDGAGSVYLHGNLIAKDLFTPNPLFSYAGWRTRTTASRLTALVQWARPHTLDEFPYRPTSSYKDNRHDDTEWWGVQ